MIETRMIENEEDQRYKRKTKEISARIRVIRGEELELCGGHSMKSAVLIIAVFFCLSLFTSSMFAADGKTVSYKSGDETVSGMIYAPAGKGPFPALIVIHEWWGLNDWVKGQASKFADEGYVALAVDLYRGKVADNP